MHGHRPGNGNRRGIDQRFVLQGHFHHLVGVVHFAEVQGQGAAAVADARLAHPLGAMQVAQRHVGEVGGEEGGGDRLLAADHDGAFAGLGDGGAVQVGVTHGHQRLAGLALVAGRLDQLAMHPADAGHVVVAGAVARGGVVGGVTGQAGAGDLGGPQEGQRQAPGAGLARLVGERHQQAFGVQGAVVAPADPAQGVGAQAVHQRGGQLHAVAAVVVAGDQHDIQHRQPCVGRDDEVVEQRLGGERGVHYVEEVTGHQQSVGPAFGQGVEQPGEEGAMLGVALLAVEALAQVPVGGMDQR